VEEAERKRAEKKDKLGESDAEMKVFLLWRIRHV